MRDQRGTTLVELMIYIGIVGIVLTTLSAFVLSLLNTRVKVQAASEVLANARLVQERLQDAVRHAEGINTGSSTFGSDPGVLSIDMVDAAVDPTVFSLTEDDGQVQVSEAGGGAVTLTTSDVSVSNLVFTNLTSGSDVGIIQVQFTIEAINPGVTNVYDYSETFQTTLRIPLDD